MINKIRLLAFLILAFLPASTMAAIFSDLEVVALEKKTIDLGSVAESSSRTVALELQPLLGGAEYELIIVVQNSSTQPFEVSKVTADCSCTAGEMSSTSVPSGGSVDLKILLRTRSSSGDFKSVVSLLQPSGGVIGKIELRAKVKDCITIEPSNLQIDEQVENRTFRLKVNTAAADLTILSVEKCRNPRFIEILSLENDRELSLSLTDRAITSSSVFSESIIVSVKKGDFVRKIELSVRFDPSKAIRLTPERIEFGSETDGMLSDYVVLAIPPDANFDDLRFHIDDQSSSVEVKSSVIRGSDRVRVLLLAVSQDAVDGLDKDAASLKISSKDAIVFSRKCSFKLE